ncbi:MAG: hypothetical protein HDR71_16925 [Lachnospiraceae bacterium]|nr:hypothetical protein [Lachnospiraceae bacterium]
MYKNCVFRLPANSNDMIYKFNLNQLLTNSRTSIYQNDFARFSIDNKVVRVLLFDENNIDLLEQIRTYFYGDAYEKL